MAESPLQNDEYVRVLAFAATRYRFTDDELSDALGPASDSGQRVAAVLRLCNRNEKDGRLRLRADAVGTYINWLAIKQAEEHTDRAEQRARRAERLSWVAITVAVVVGLATVCVGILQVVLMLQE